MDQGHRTAAGPRLLWVGVHKFYTPVVSIGTHDIISHLCIYIGRITGNSVLCCQLKRFKPFVISCRATQFRWIQKEGAGERQSWGVDHVYIGEACPGLCSGNGYCTSGVVCICDEGHHGGPQAAYYVQTAAADTDVVLSHLYWSEEK